MMLRLPAAIRRIKLRTRVLAGVVTVTLVSLAGFSYAATNLMYGYLIGQTDSNLQVVYSEYKMVIMQVGQLPSGSTKPRTMPDQGSPGDKSPTESFQQPPLLDTYYVAIKDNTGQLSQLFGDNINLVPGSSGTIATGPYTATSSNRQNQLRVLAEPVGNFGTLIVTTSLSGLDSTISRLRVIVIISSLSAAVLVVAGVGFVVRRGLRPVETMAMAADKITAGDLTSRVLQDDPATEVGRLGTALNRMLTRIEASVHEREASEQATRRFFADASHELRTPLASLRANAELYRQGALSRRSEVDEAMRRIMIEARRMGILVDDMLRLARLDQHPRLDRKPVNLSALATECVERARIAHRKYTWEASVTPDLSTMGDEELLRRAIDNMLANVATHTPAGTTAVLTVAARQDIIAIEVSDNGPGIPSGELPHIFDRFYRTRTPAPRSGSGLGLAIVAATAEVHSGQAQAELNAPSGLRVTLAVPAGEG
jgi:two-component system, OmpR family, sensor kinase